MKFTQVIVHLFHFMMLSFYVSATESYGFLWWGQSLPLHSEEFLQSECSGPEQGELHATINEIMDHIPSLREEHYWPEQAISLLEGFLAKYRIQESIWLLNRHKQRQLGDKLEASLHQHLLCAPISSMDPLGGGATQTWLLSFKNPDQAEHPQVKAVYKPQQANLSSHVGSEVATYRIDRLLQTDLVPLTVSRKVKGKNSGSLQYFIKDAKKISDPDLPNSKKQKTARMYLLDFLTKNIDRGDFLSPKKIKFEYNYLYLPSLDQLVAIDNSWALRSNYLPAKLKSYWVDKRDASEKRYRFPNQQKPELEFYVRLEKLDADTLHANLDGVICSVAIEKVLKRKAKVLRAFEVY